MNERKSQNCLAGRVALISGGAQGIGRAIAALFQREGACVFVLDCDTKSGKETASDLAAQNPSLPVTFLSADLREASHIQGAMDALHKAHDRLDADRTFAR